MARNVPYEAFSQETWKKVRLLRNAMEWNVRYEDVEKREQSIGLIRNLVAEEVLTVLLAADKERQNHFLSER